MANNLEQAFSLNDRVSDTLSVWTKVRRQLEGFDPAPVLRSALSEIETFVAGARSAWETRTRAEASLAGVMRQSMGASDDEIAAIVRLTEAQQALGVVSGRVQMAGAQRLAAGLARPESLEILVPAMNDLLVRQRGFDATEQDAAGAGELMSRVMQGQTAVLPRAGLAFTAAEEQVLRCGDELQRAAALARIVADNAGGMNRALAATPAGGLRQHANTMADLQVRIGRLVLSVQAALLPLFDAAGGSLAELTGWFERNGRAVSALAGGMARVLGAAFSAVGRVAGFLLGLLGGWLVKLQEGHGATTAVTAALGSLAAAMALVSLRARAMAVWSGIVTTAKRAWAATQGALNLSLLLCPVTWIVAGVIALIGTIAYLCYKIEGWGSLWEGVVGFMKYSFMVFADSVRLCFAAMVNGIMSGLDTIRLGWYGFRETLGLGDSAENRTAVARIAAEAEARRAALADGVRKVAENAVKAREALSGINMSWSSGSSSAGETGPMSGFGAAEAFGMLPSFGAGAESTPEVFGMASSIAAGGSRPASVTINLRSLVENVVFEGGWGQHRDEMQRDLESALIRVLQMADSAL